jgi:hypothetical protein
MRSPCRAYLCNGQFVSGLRCESALGAGVIEGTKAKEHQQRILDHLGVTLTALPCILLTGAPHQLLVQRQIDLARSHAPRIPPPTRCVQGSVRSVLYVLDTFQNWLVLIATVRQGSDS